MMTSGAVESPGPSELEAAPPAGPTHDSIAQEEKNLLQEHRSSLPDFFYLLSFAPPLPSLFKQPRAFFRHPIILYAIGFVTAIFSGFASFPVLDLLYGLYWSNGISYAATPAVIREKSNFPAIIAIVTAAVLLLASWVFQVCCELLAYSIRT